MKGNFVKHNLVVVVVVVVVGWNLMYSVCIERLALNVKVASSDRPCMATTVKPLYTYSLSDSN